MLLRLHEMIVSLRMFIETLKHIQSESDVKPQIVHVNKL